MSDITVAFDEFITSSVIYAPGDTVTLSGTDVQFRNMSAAQIATFKDRNVDFITRTSGHNINWSAEKASAFAATSCLINAGTRVDVVDGADALLALNAATMAALSAKGVTALWNTSSKSLVFSADWHASLGNMFLITPSYPNILQAPPPRCPSRSSRLSPLRERTSRLRRAT
jgi:hypothetical protein